jgi:hypothetical protein
MEKMHMERVKVVKRYGYGQNERIWDKELLKERWGSQSTPHKKYIESLERGSSPTPALHVKHHLKHVCE